MREIKFRVWDKEIERMFTELTIDSIISQTKEMGYHWISETDCIIEQFTGLQDKNGKEIYEGDILGTVCGGKMISSVMTWEEHDAAWAKFYPLSCFEIVGNIHENPEIEVL